MIVGTHKEVWEYDGAFGCLKCKRKWGALPGKPVMPENCEKNPYQERFDYLTAEINRLEKERSLLRETMEIA